MVSLHDADEILAVYAKDDPGLLPPVLNVCGVFAAALELQALQGVGEAVAGVPHRSFLFYVNTSRNDSTAVLLLLQLPD